MKSEHSPQSSIDEDSLVNDIFGDVVSGDKISGDKVGGNKIIYHTYIGRRVTTRQRLSIGIFIASVMIFAGLFFYAQANQPIQKMTGDFRVAVVPFSVNGVSPKTEFGVNLAKDVALRLQGDISASDLDMIVTVWNSYAIEEATGIEPSEQLSDVHNLATMIGADLIIYGTVDIGDAIWEITPYFYVSSNNFYEADDLTGSHSLGEPFITLGGGGLASRMALNDEMTERAQLAAQLAIGLAYDAAHKYEKAAVILLDVENEAVWKDNANKELLYLLLGNIANAQRDMVLAESYYEQALAINPEYARAYVGLANVYYYNAISKTPDWELVEQAIETFEHALTASDYAEYAEIEAKVHFGLGQTYLLQALAGKTAYQTAFDEFEKVITAFGDGSNPRLRILAAESYARIGLMYREQNQITEAIAAYQNGVDLLADYPDRQVIFEERVRTLQATLPDGA